MPPSRGSEPWATLSVETHRRRGRSMTRTCSLIFLLPLSFLSCDTSRHRTPAPVFFAKRIDDAERDFDRNRFLSFRKDGLLSAPLTLGNETRLSLTPPLPSRLTFTVQVPSDPLLRFSIGVSTLGGEILTNPVDFAVYVASDGEEVRCFRETVRRAQPNRWLEQTVDLTPWSGKNVGLTFETTPHEKKSAGAGSGSLLPAWGNPVLVSSQGRRAGSNLGLITVD